jgi:hypothetical protein
MLVPRAIRPRSVAHLAISADETRWSYDTANDGDTIYVLVNIADSSGEPPDAIGPLGVPGTSAVVEWQMLFHFFDDAARDTART